LYLTLTFIFWGGGDEDGDGDGDGLSNLNHFGHENLNHDDDCQSSTRHDPDPLHNHSVYGLHENIGKTSHPDTRLESKWMGQNYDFVVLRTVASCRGLHVQVCGNATDRFL
jgi:hypothetical protein